MAVVDRIRRYFQSPQGRRTRARVERMARDPRTQAKARRLLSRFRGGGRRRY
ncbi:hypothetical protein FHX41_5772 [Actinomadura hallensis]|uniref:Uncharacterized protein n=1 Tax=Actinomadura hallensis TaxID=337895 RepID=A0A543IN86_9ACTN|nr:hypothetical protein [Actinomadura hallensis]TQM71988.1 hypothetical protein FHX41_5772 [Actinomadura hallensis]HLV71521.1 hypothetical protein [Vulgatibacteraceae bacterium]